MAQDGGCAAEHSRLVLRRRETTRKRGRFRFVITLAQRYLLKGRFGWLYEGLYLSLGGGCHNAVDSLLQRVIECHRQACFHA